MEKKIVEFANLLRGAGVRVSVAETLDAFRAIDELSLDDRELFRDALRATLVKRSDDVDTYDRLFDLYWSGFHDRLRTELDRALGKIEGLDLDGLFGRLHEALEGMDLDLGELARAMLSLDANALEQMILRAGENAGVEGIRNILQVGFFGRRIVEQMNLDGAGEELRSLLDQLRERGFPEESIEALSQLFGAIRDALRNAARQLAERELDKNSPEFVERLRRESLREKSFFNLTQEDVARMREIVARLAQKMKNIVNLRRKRERRGTFDLKATMRRNMTHGGVPFEIVLRRRRKEKPKLVVLCDVSSSVANVSRFFLQFSYSLHELFTHIRSYVFVAELGEVTRLFREKDLFDALDEALEGGGVINAYTRSNFGQAFHVFWRDHLAVLDRRTTVVVIGDARNNYSDPKAWCLREIQSKAKNVIWINPEARSSWGFGDSVMDKYLPYIDVAEECRNLRQLSALVDRLVL